MLRNSLMPWNARLTAAGLVAAASLVVAGASAQPAPLPPPPALPPPAAPPPAPPPAASPAPQESLETPYQDPPPPDMAPPSPPPPAPPRAGVIRLDVPDTRPALPIVIRERRRLALTGEIGWNGLAGFGPVLTYYAHPQVALDLGLGFSLMGGKAGLRTRYVFLKSNLSPFIGAGINATTGFGEATSDPAQNPDASEPTRDPVTVNVGASYLVQGVVGLDYIHRRGFTLLVSGGYAHLLNDNNWRVLAGELTAEEEEGFNIAFGGGLVLSVSMGYAFE